MTTCIDEKIFLYSIMSMGLIYIPTVTINTLRKKYKNELLIDKINSVVTKIYPFILILSLFAIFMTFSSGKTISEKFSSPEGKYFLLSTFTVFTSLYIKVIIRPDYYYRKIRIHSFIAPLFITGVIAFNSILYYKKNDRSIKRIIITILTVICLITAGNLTTEDSDLVMFCYILYTMSIVILCLNNSYT